jgi:sec-independent protein translocase protein TatB
MFDFGIGSTELILIAVVALIVIGPKDLPKVLRTVGQVLTKVRAMAREFQGHIEDAAKDVGLDDLKKDITKAAKFDMNETLADVGREPGKVSKPASKDAPKSDAPKSDAAKTETAKAEPANKAKPAKAKSTTVGATKAEGKKAS